MKSIVVLVISILLFCTSTIRGFQDTSVVFHKGEVYSLQWSPDATLLALQGAGGTWIYGMDGELIKYLEETDFRRLDGGGLPPDSYSSAWGTGVDWHPEGSRLVTPFYDLRSQTSSITMALKIWDATNWQIITTYNWGWDSTSIKWSPNGEQIAVAYRGKFDAGFREWLITLFPGLNDSPVVLNLGETAIHDIDWDSDSNRIAAARSDGTANIINVNPLRAMNIDRETNLQTFHIQDDAINAIEWQPEKELVATGGDDGLIYLWDTNTGEVVSNFEVHQSSINALDWNSDGTLLASAGEDAIIRIWDVETGQVIATFEGHEDEIIDLDWSPDDQFIATASLDDTVRIWEVDLAVDE